MAGAADITAHSERPPLIRLGRVEARKMVDTRAGFWLLLITALGAVAGALAERFASGGGDVSIGDIFLTSAAVASFLLPVVGILLVTGEWSQRTGLITFALVPIRERVIASKLIAALAIATLGAVLALLCAAVCSVGADGSGLELEELGRGFLALWITVSIGVGLGLLVTNSPAAIVIYFLGPILVSAIGAISESINEVTVWLDQSALIPLSENPGPMGDDWGRIGVTVLVWALLPLVVGMLRLRRGDID